VFQVPEYYLLSEFHYFLTSTPINKVFDSREKNTKPSLGIIVACRPSCVLLKKYKGLAILWEHRFYSASLFP
ncbi:hypothetical protein BYT27DRAFT_7343431, partial [Phlegmacium glaucopus]